MASKALLNPIYLRNRTLEKIYRFRNPDVPWLTRDAIVLLDSMLRPTDVGLEFGSGRSTPWLAQRVGHLTSVEHNRQWYDQIARSLNSSSISNVTLDYQVVSDDLTPPSLENYTSAVHEFQDGTLDFAIVDGIFRLECAQLVIPKIGIGGILVIDDSQRYLPSSTETPTTRRNRRTPATADWEAIWQQLDSWRKILTSDGVRDTNLFIRVV